MDNDKINPSHYKDGFPRKPVECIEVAEHLPFCLGNAIKYIWRAGKKDGEDLLTDLAKARWYLERQDALKEYPHGLERAYEVLEKVAVNQMDTADFYRYDAIRKILRNPSNWLADVIELESSLKMDMDMGLLYRKEELTNEAN